MADGGWHKQTGVEIEQAGSANEWAPHPACECFALFAVQLASFAGLAKE